MKYFTYILAFFINVTFCLSQNTSIISKCNCRDDISALPFGNLEKSQGMTKVTFLSSFVDSSHLSFHNEIPQNLYKNIFPAGKIKSTLYINIYQNILDNSLDGVNFSKITALFQVTDLSGKNFIVFNDANLDRLFAMKKDLWDYLKGISGQTKIYAIEVQNRSNDSNKYHKNYDRINTELFFIATKQDFSDDSLFNDFIEKNSNSFAVRNKDGLKIETKIFETNFDQMYWYENTSQESFNKPAFITSKDSNIYSWAFDNSIYLESFVRKHCPKDLFNIDGLNLNFNFNTIQPDLLTNSFWLEKIKADSLLQSLIIPIHIDFGPLYGGNENSLYSLKHPSELAYSPIKPDTRYVQFFSSSLVNKQFDITLDKFPPFYSLNKNTVEEKMACAIQNILSDFNAKLIIRNESINERKIEDQKRAQYKSDLISKYGQKYVDEALNGNITIGMPEDLITIPLRVWSVTSVSKFNDGYDMYCSFQLDVSKRIRISVRNGKVSAIKNY